MLVETHTRVRDLANARSNLGVDKRVRMTIRMLRPTLRLRATIGTHSNRSLGGLMRTEAFLVQTTTIKLNLPDGGTGLKMESLSSAEA